MWPTRVTLPQKGRDTSVYNCTCMKGEVSTKATIHGATCCNQAVTTLLQGCHNLVTTVASNKVAPYIKWWP